MLVFKFGGASVKDADAVRNVAAILADYTQEKLVVVVSAMGKMTNALEAVVAAYMNRSPDLAEKVRAVRDFHEKILHQLGFEASHPVHTAINNAFVEIDWILEEEPLRDYGYTYDQIVSQGELLATRIVSAYLEKAGYANSWLDARDVIQTDNNYREGKVNWDTTVKLVRWRLPELLNKTNIVITQGFIGATSENFSTTLGREGSDYSAAIFSYCLDAKEMTVWKDVPGVLSADPKFYDDAVKLEQISYHDAIELTYYGATVIHPKTIKPLENKGIPMRVRSFKAPQEKGTSIGNYQATKPLVPCFIFKTNQILLSIAAKDFSFIAEENLSRIFSLFADHRAKVNLMQNSAISFSICLDNDPHKVPALIEALGHDFRVLYNDRLKLVTVRHYYPSTIDQITKGKTILLEQRSRQTAQVVIRENE